MSFSERLWAKIDKRGPDDCWEWTASRLQGGYGNINRGAGRGNALAHRAVFEGLNGAIPPGLVVRHRCDNPPCCNPAHLELGSQADNVADMMSRGRQVAPRGMHHHAAKLTDAKVRDIRAASGGLRALVGHFGVPKSTISHIRTGRTWAHVV